MLKDETMRLLGWSPALIDAVERVAREIDQVGLVIPSIPGVFSEFDAAFCTETIEAITVDVSPTSSSLIIDSTQT